MSLSLDKILSKTVLGPVCCAQVVKLADTLSSGGSIARCRGSTPLLSTKVRLLKIRQIANCGRYTRTFIFTYTPGIYNGWQRALGTKAWITPNSRASAWGTRSKNCTSISNEVPHKIHNTVRFFYRKFQSPAKRSNVFDEFVQEKYKKILQIFYEKRCEVPCNR